MERISLYKEFGSNILTRKSMAAFFEKVIDKSKQDDIVIDFKNIKFISRSCAVEYLKLREERNKNLIESNMSEEVKLMFNLVLNNLKSINFVFKKEAMILK